MFVPIVYKCCACLHLRRFELNNEAPRALRTVEASAILNMVVTASAWPGAVAWAFLVGQTFHAPTLRSLVENGYLTLMRDREDVVQFTVFGLKAVCPSVTLEKPEKIFKKPSADKPWSEYVAYEAFLSLIDAGFEHVVVQSPDGVPPYRLRSSEVRRHAGLPSSSVLPPSEAPVDESQQKKFYSLKDDHRLRRNYLVFLARVVIDVAFREVQSMAKVSVPHFRSEAYYGKLLSTRVAAQDEGPVVEFENEGTLLGARSAVAGVMHGLVDQQEAKRRKKMMLKRFQSFRWGAIPFLFKQSKKDEARGRATYQVTCCRRTHVTLLTSGGRTLCTKSLTWDMNEEGAGEDIIRRLKFWACQCHRHSTKHRHSRWVPKSEDVPPDDELEQLMIPQDREGTDDEEVATILASTKRAPRRANKAKAKAKAVSQSSASAAQSLGQACLPEPQPASQTQAAQPSASSSSTSTSSSSSSSSSSADSSSSESSSTSSD